MEQVNAMDFDEAKAELRKEMTDSTGYYKLENGKLYTSDSKDFEEDDAESYELTATTLIIEKDGVKLTFKRK